MSLHVDHLVLERTGGPILVDEATFSVHSGQMVGLVGESGCGKTLTALAVMGLLPRGIEKIGGELQLQGRAAMIFQEPASALNPVLTVGSQIAETVEVHQKVTSAQAREKAIDLMRAVGIADPVERFGAWPHQLSGGMRQRILIAAAIASEPSVLIADEPTTALDVTVQAQILALLHELKERRGLAILLITHDLGVVAEACDDVAVMYAGRIVERAPVADLLRQPSHPYSGALLAARPGLATRGKPLDAIPGTVPPPEQRPTWCAFVDRCPKKLPKCAKVNPPLPEGRNAFACHNPLP